MVKRSHQFSRNERTWQDLEREREREFWSTALEVLEQVGR